MRRSVYLNRPIATVTALARALSCSPDLLNRLCIKIESHYFPPKRQLKRDGGFRETRQAKDDLDRVHIAILRRILDRVKHPPYLQGSIKDKETHRSYIIDATHHIDSAVVISIDIKNFFPSTKSEIIFDIWKYFFAFPDAVASLLTNLTTLQGSLPQGARTSPSLANLVFYNKEPELENFLRQRGMRYTRYVDDVTVSANRHLTSEELEIVFRQVFGMFKSKGMSPKRSKIVIATKGHPQQIHHLNVNAGRPTIPSGERSRIRAAVRECEFYAKQDPDSPKFAQLWLSTSGRVQMMHNFHSNEAAKYLERLNAIKPSIHSTL